MVISHNFNLAAIYLHCVSIYSVQCTLHFLNFMLVSSLGNLPVGEIATLLKLNDMKHLLIRLFKGNCLDSGGPHMWDPCENANFLSV